MTIDERLEALTHSVELIASMQKTNERQIRSLGKYIRAIARMSLDHQTRLNAIEGTDDGFDEAAEQ